MIVRLAQKMVAAGNCRDNARLYQAGSRSCVIGENEKKKPAQTNEQRRETEKEKKRAQRKETSHAHQQVQGLSGKRKKEGANEKCLANMEKKRQPLKGK